MWEVERLPKMQWYWACHTVKVNEAGAQLYCSGSGDLASMAYVEHDVSRASSISLLPIAFT